MKPFRITASYFNGRYWYPEKAVVVEASNWRVAIQRSGRKVKDMFTISRFTPGCRIDITIEPLRPIKFASDERE